MFNSTKNQINVIVPGTLAYYLKPDEPLHKSFDLLSSVHKSDYLRAYFVHYRGGAYVDIKHMHVDLVPYLDKLYHGRNPDGEEWEAGGEYFRRDVFPACHPEPGEISCE